MERTPPRTITIIDPTLATEGEPSPVPLDDGWAHIVPLDIYNESGIFIETPNLPSSTIDPVE